MGKVLYTQQPYGAVCFVEPAPIHFVHHYLHTFHIYVLCASSLFYSLCSIVLVSHRAWSSENRIALIVLSLKVRLIVVLPLLSKISTTFKSMTNRSFVKVQTLYTPILYLNIRKANNKFNFTSRRQILHFIFFSYGPQNPCTVSYRYRWMDCVNNWTCIVSCHDCTQFIFEG